MQIKAPLFALALATLAAAAPPIPRDSNQCNTGPIQCCLLVQPASESPASILLALLGIVLIDPTTPVGVTCNPVNNIGLEGKSCSGQPVCCTNNNFNGIVAIGCTPININI